MSDHSQADVSAQRIFNQILRARTETGTTVALMLAKLAQAAADGGKVEVDPQNFSTEQGAAAAAFAEFVNGSSGSELS